MTDRRGWDKSDAPLWMPVDFRGIYQRAFGQDPPAVLMDTYEELTWRLYRDVSGAATDTVGRGSAYHNSWPFRNVGLLGLKARTDKYLAATAEAIARWEGRSARKSRPRHRGARRGANPNS